MAKENKEVLNQEQLNEARNNAKLAKYEQEINNYNQKYGTDLEFNELHGLIETRVRLLTRNENEDLISSDIASYRLSYKKVAKKVLSNPRALLQLENKDQLDDFNKLVDDGLYYVTNAYESGMFRNVIALGQYEIQKSDDGSFVTTYNSKDNSYKKSLENGMFRYSKSEDGTKENSFAKIYYSNVAYLNDCEIVDGKDGIVFKSVGYVANGAMGKNEYKEFVKDQLFRANAFEDFNQVSALKEELEANHLNHSADIIDLVGSKFTEAAQAYRFNSHPDAEAAQRLINKVAPAYAILKEKRESRGFFGVLFHPFKAHAETVALENIRSQMATELRKANLFAADFDRAVSNAKKCPSEGLAQLINDTDIDFDNGKERLTKEALADHFKNLENSTFPKKVEVEIENEVSINEEIKEEVKENVVEEEISKEKE